MFFSLSSDALYYMYRLHSGIVLLWNNSGRKITIDDLLYLFFICLLITSALFSVSPHFISGSLPQFSHWPPYFQSLPTLKQFPSHHQACNLKHQDPNTCKEHSVYPCPLPCRVEASLSNFQNGSVMPMSFSLPQRSPAASLGSSHMQQWFPASAISNPSHQKVLAIGASSAHGGSGQRCQGVTALGN